jgi:hypothetical protein
LTVCGAEPIVRREEFFGTVDMPGAGLGWVNKGTLKNTIIKVIMKSLIRVPRI